MQGWQPTYLGMRELPREISTFELQAFFTFSPAERELIEARRGNRLKLGLALHIGFLRMSGRLLDAFRVIPSVLWRHLGTELGIDAPGTRIAACDVWPRPYLVRPPTGCLRVPWIPMDERASAPRPGARNGRLGLIVSAYRSTLENSDSPV